VSIALKKVALVDALGGIDVLNADTKGLVLYVPFALSLSDGTAFGSTGVLFSYSAHLDRSGSGKLMKK